MRITFDPAKRAKTLEERGLDFADAAEVFAGLHTVAEDARRDYGEPRFITAGYLHGGNARRVISMRYGNAKEEARWREALG